MKRVQIIVYGRAQGISFRYYSKRKALELDVTGWVMNLDNYNKIEFVLEGKDENVDEMVEWCKQGPNYALIKKIDIIEQEYKGKFDGFEVRYM